MHWQNAVMLQNILLLFSNKNVARIIWWYLQQKMILIMRVGELLKFKIFIFLKN